MPEGSRDRLRRRCRELRERGAGRRRALRRNSLVAMMSHELREPMNGVLGLVRLLAETTLDADQRSWVEAIDSSAEALLTVLNDLLDLARIDAGRIELVDVPFEPRLLVERLLVPFRLKADAKGLRLAVSIDPTLPGMLRGDPGRLRQVLVNLLGNAVKFTDTGGIRLGLARIERDGAAWLRAEVEDSGPGFDAATRARLFRAFGQADAATPRLFGGSGLGLVLSARLADAMGGRLAADGRPGKGACFTVELPMLEPPVLEPADARPPAAETGGSIAGLQLLIVEPIAEWRARLRGLVAALDVDLRVAASAADAMREIREAATRGVVFELALLGTGIEPAEAQALLAELRRRHAGLRAVSVAPSGLRGDAATAQALGYDAYLAAPFTSAELRQFLERLERGERGALLTRHDLAASVPKSLDILVADDNPVNLQVARLVLEKAGHRISAVKDGAAAVAAVRDRRFDLVLMDVQMPGMDGLEATRLIRRLDRPDRCAVPIVALTAEALAEDERAVRAAGMDDYLTKPIDRPRLLATVRHWGEQGVAMRTSL